MTPSSLVHSLAAVDRASFSPNAVAKMFVSQNSAITIIAAATNRLARAAPAKGLAVVSVRKVAKASSR